MKKPTSLAPYIFSGCYQWLVDNDYTPIIVVNVAKLTPFNSKLPKGVENTYGEAVFNISPSAVRSMIVGKGIIEFWASFNGIHEHIKLPITSIELLYADEDNNVIMEFDTDEPELEEVKLPDNIVSLFKSKDE